MVLDSEEELHVPAFPFVHATDGFFKDFRETVGVAHAPLQMPVRNDPDGCSQAGIDQEFEGFEVILGESGAAGDVPLCAQGEGEIRSCEYENAAVIPEQPVPAKGDGDFQDQQVRLVSGPVGDGGAAPGQHGFQGEAEISVYAPFADQSHGRTDPRLRIDAFKVGKVINGTREDTQSRAFESVTVGAMGMGLA